MGREQEIEDRVVENLEWFGYPGASWIRRAKLAREGAGAVDVLLLPRGGAHRLVLVEVKHQDSHDTPGRVVGQLLAYYLAALRLGSEGVERLRRFSAREEAHSTRVKSLQMLSGLGKGAKHRDLKALRAGTPLTPSEVGLILVWGRATEDEDDRESLRDLRDWLYHSAGADIVESQAKQEGFQAELRRLEGDSRRVARTGQIPDGFVLDARDVDRGEVSRAEQACDLDRVSPVVLDLVAGRGAFA